MKVAIQGQPGSFHDSVAQQFFGKKIDLVCCETFQEVFETLNQKNADQAVCAVENSLYGSITEVYDLLSHYTFPIVGEATEHIHQQLIALDGTQMAAITEIYSHPVALNQCRDWLEKNLPHAELVEHHDTAGAVEHIKQLGSPYAAAIAGQQAASLYGVPILVSDIEDEKTNLTRFFILDPHGKPPVDANKASLVLTTSHEPGALYHALGVFDKHHVNLTKLASRPIRGKQFRYHFFVDAECNATTLKVMTDELATQKCDVKLLGHYCAS